MDGLYPPNGKLQLNLRKGEAILPSLGQEHPIILSPSVRSRRFKGVIRDGKPVLVIPKRATSTQTKEVLISLEGWFAKAVQRVSEEKQIIGESSILLLGREVPYRPDPSLAQSWALTDSGLLLRTESQESAGRLARSWLYRQAEIRINRAVQRWGTAIGFENIPVRIIETSSRWGSCAASQRLSFCWRQIMAPPEVIEYLAVHEIVHMRHSNHGPRYWQMVEQFYPDYEIWDRWLGRKGSILMHLYPRQPLSSLRIIKPNQQAAQPEDLEGFRLVF